MRNDIRAATRRRWLAVFGSASLALATSACEAPAHAAVTSCSGAKFGNIAAKKDCTVAIAKFDQQTSARFQLDTKRRDVVVQGRFTVTRGTARIAQRNRTGTVAEIVVGPDAPATLDSTLHLGLRNRDFHLVFHPQGEVEGLAGQLSYETR
ncbi:hypothetical protein ACW5EG_01580 [Luteimonas sp. A611]